MEIRCWKWGLGFAGWISLSLCAHSAIAQLIPDTASDRSLGTTVVPATPQIDLITGGTRPGNGINLFHSFQELNVQNGRAVYFTNPAGVQNILSRITGINPSNIFGTLGVFGGNANLFLINPNGIVFGPNARLNVGGSFVATTANAIQFAEQGFFNVSNPQALPLLTVNPSALLFNQIPTGNITNFSTASAGLDPAGGGVFGLRVPDGQSLLLVGGDVNLVGGRLNALGGRVEIGGLAEPGTVGITSQGSVPNLSFSPHGTRSNVALTNAAQAAVNTVTGGSLTISAQNITLADGSALYAGIRNFLGNGNSQGGDITLDATGAIALNNSFIFNTVQQGSTGQGGNIIIQSDSLSLTNNAQITTGTFGQGNTGTVSIQARDSVFLDQEAYIFSSVGPGGVGDAGGITLATNSLELRDGSQLVTGVQPASGFLPAGQGNAGDVNINVRGQVKMTGIGTKTQFPSGISSLISKGVTGNAGDININSGYFLLTAGARLSASTFGYGTAGNVNVNVQEAIVIAGVSGLFRSGIFSTVENGAIGNGGDINITTGSLALTNQSRLSTATFGQGDAGRISIQARGTVFLDQDAYVLSGVEAGGVGNAGGIALSAKSLELRGGAELLTVIQKAFGSLPPGRGNAGDINVNVQEGISISGVGQFRSGIFSGVDPGATGNGGNITLITHNLELKDQAWLDTSTQGQGNAGSILIQAKNEVFLDQDARIFSNVANGGVGDGGNVNLVAKSLELRRGAQIITGIEPASTVLPAGRGNAGNVNIHVQEAIKIIGIGNLPSGIFSLTSFGSTGNAGDINVNSGSLSLTGGARLSASTLGYGRAGNVNVNVQEAINISGFGGGFRSGIFSTVENGAIGNGGNINVTTGSLALTEQARLSAATAGNGNAGSVSIQARGGVFLDTGATIASSVVIGGVGEGGDVNVSANSLELRGGSELVASAFGRGNAGNINVNTRGTIQANSGTFRTEALQGSGGAITLQAEAVRLVGDSDIITFVASGAGGGGDITLTADAIIALNDSDILAFAQDGKGGNVTLNTPVFLGQNYRPAPPGTNPFTLDRNDRVDINASGAVSGVISLPDLTYLQHPLVSLSQNLIDTNTILANSCIVRTRDGGTFLITGVGGLPVRPGDAPVPYFSTGTVQTIETGRAQTLQLRSPQENEMLVEAQGVYRLNNGQLVLSWECPR